MNLQLSLYVHKDRRIGAAVWRDGKCLDFREWIPAASQPKVLLKYYERLISELCADFSYRFNHDTFRAGAIEKQARAEKHELFVKNIRRFMSRHVDDVIETESNHETLDLAIRFIEAAGGQATVYLSGGVASGLAAGFGNKIDIDRPEREIALTLLNPQYAVDPGLRDVLLNGLNDFCKKTAKFTRLDRDDCAMLFQVTLLSRLPGMEKELKKELNGFADGVLDLWKGLRDEARLAHTDKRIEVSTGNLLKAEIEKIMDRLDGLEDETG